MDNPLKTQQSKRGLTVLALLTIAAVIFALDQWTKSLVVKNLDLFDSWSPIPAFSRIFQFTHTFNTGAAFGMFKNGGSFFLIVAIIVVAAIVYYVSTNPALPAVVILSLGMQMGGAMGNLSDRVFRGPELFRGSVVDFIDVGFWPIGNIADISIILGVIILAIWLWKEDEKRLEAAVSEA